MHATSNNQARVRRSVQIHTALDKAVEERAGAGVPGAGVCGTAVRGVAGTGVDVRGAGVPREGLGFGAATGATVADAAGHQVGNWAEIRAELTTVGQLCKREVKASSWL